MKRYYVHTWVIRLELFDPESAGFIDDLKYYLVGGSISPAISKKIANHPRFVKWFGEDIQGDPAVIEMVGAVGEKLGKTGSTQPLSYLGEIEDYMNSMNVANVLPDILSLEYPAGVQTLEMFVLPFESLAYNIYPHQIAHFLAANKKTYIPGFGHECGHILTWDLCSDEEIRTAFLEKNIVGYAERIAEICSKLLMDYYRIAFNEVFTRCLDWDRYLPETHPEYKFFLHLIENVKLNSVGDFKKKLLQVVEDYRV